MLTMSVMAKLRRLGTTWAVKRGVVTVFMFTVGRDAYSVAERCRRAWKLNAVEATPDDCPPEVPEGLVLVRVSAEQFDAFVETIARDIAENAEEHEVYPTVEDAWDSEAVDGHVAFEETPQGKALLAMAEVRK